jgi:hypothetical protein
VSEVELDTLTGDARVTRADILMDVGLSINPVRAALFLSDRLGLCMRANLSER